jgi:Domain of unknown function (DUF4351)
MELAASHLIPRFLMSRTPFDAFSKQLLQAILDPLGQVNLNREVSGEPRWVDVWFEPSPAASPEPDGLLGQMAATPCLFEPFRAQPPVIQMLNCKHKLFSVFGELQRQAERENRTISDALEGFPRLWVLTPSASDTLLRRLKLEADPNWPSGVYFASEADRTALVAINQLPATPDTLWLRLLGKGRTQHRAIAEVLALPLEDPSRLLVLQLLATWKISMEVSEFIEQEEQELMMQLTQAYLEWEQRTEQRGIEQGERLLIQRQLSRRVGPLSPELQSRLETLALAQLESLAEALLDFETMADLETWLERQG